MNNLQFLFGSLALIGLTQINQAAVVLDFANVNSTTSGTIGDWTVTTTGFDGTTSTNLFNSPGISPTRTVPVDAWVDQPAQTAGSITVSGGTGTVSDFRIHIGQTLADTTFSLPFTIISQTTGSNALAGGTNPLTGFLDTSETPTQDASVTLSFGAVTSVSWTHDSIVPTDGAVFQLGITTIPEPSSILLAGLSTLFLLRRRR